MKEFNKEDLTDYINSSQIGLWKLEIESGVAVRMYVDSIMESLIGISENESPEECCKFFMEHIHPHDYPLITDCISNMANDETEFICRYIHPVKKEIKVYCSGRKIKTEKNIDIIAGHYKEVNNITYLNNEENYKNTLNKIACGVVSYTVPEYDNLYMNYKALQISGFENSEDASRHLGDFMKRVIYRNNIILQKLIELRNNDGYLDYQCAVPNVKGEVFYLLAHTESATNSSGQRSVCTTFFDISENKSLKNEREILKALCKDYSFILWCDLQTNDCFEINLYNDSDRNISDFKRQYIKNHFKVNENKYSLRMKLYYDVFVNQQASSDFLEKLDSSFLMKYLSEHNGQFIYRYQVKSGFLDSEYFEIKIVQLNDESSCNVVMGFRMIDDLIFEEKKQKEQLQEINTKLKEQLNTIGGLSNAYFAVYWVDLNSNKCRSLKNIPFFEQAVKDCKTIDDVVNIFNNLCVQPEDKEKMLDFTDWRRLKESLDKTNVIVEEFHGMVSEWEWCRASWIVAVRDKNGAPSSVLFTVEEISASIAERKQRELELKLLEEQNQVINGLSKEYITVLLITKNGKSSIKFQDYGQNSIAKEPKFFSQRDFDYTNEMKKYIDNYLCEEDKKEFSKKVQYEVVLEQIRKVPVYSVIYRRNYNGKKEYFQVSYTLADSSGKSNDFVMGFKNINDVVLAEHQKNEALSIALTSAEYANHAKTQFLNNMSHDIRTPMNAIIGFTALASSHIDNKEKVKEYLRKIEISGEHLLSLINDVLDMSRIESGKVKIDEKILHLPDLLHDIRTIIQPTVSSKQLDFLIDTVDVIDEDIITDKLRLTQILLNILGNGVKFNKTGGTISLRVKQEKKAPEGYACYHFIIRDTGIGISKDFQKHIFENFARAENATVSGIQGTGLGLAITKKIVDMMGGTINLKSEEGIGSEFDVCLTFKLSGEKKVYKKIDFLQGLRVLVADDDTDTCLSISTMLTEIGMRSEWTVSGKEAVVRAKHAVDMGDQFYAYIIDWLMPDMNGIETVRRIRRVIGDSSPIIILTAYDWADVEEEAKEAGVTAFCEKPLFMSELRDILLNPVPIVETTPKFNNFSPNGKKILLVEDNELNQEIAVEILGQAGFIVETAENGSVAVEKMKSSQSGQYDLILMDIQMPVLNGYEATKMIRAMENTYCKNIPIVAMTANAFDEDRELAIKAGMNGYLTKPVQIDKMLEIINSLL